VQENLGTMKAYLVDARAHPRFKLEVDTWINSRTCGVLFDTRIVLRCGAIALSATKANQWYSLGRRTVDVGKSGLSKVLMNAEEVVVSFSSATQSEVQRNQPGVLWKFQGMGAILKLFLPNRAEESVSLVAPASFAAFFSGGHPSSLVQTNAMRSQTDDVVKAA
jgi:hypothetical protein